MLVVREIEENGIMYRITEDEETGLFIQEPLNQGEPEPPQPDRIAQLEAENAELKAQQQQMSADLQGFMDFYFSL